MKPRMTRMGTDKREMVCESLAAVISELSHADYVWSLSYKVSLISFTSVPICVIRGQFLLDCLNRSSIPKSK